MPNWYIKFDTKWGSKRGVEKTGKVGKVSQVKKILIAGVLAAMGWAQAQAQGLVEAAIAEVEADADEEESGDDGPDQGVAGFASFGHGNQYTSLR